MDPVEELGKERLRVIRALQTKKGRERQGRTVIEGVRLLETALAAGVQPELVLYSPKLLRSDRGEQLLQAMLAAGVRTHPVDERTLARVAATETPQGVLAVVAVPAAPLEQLLAQERPFLLAIDGLQDPGNLGTMLRTAAAVGASGVLLGKGAVERTNPKALRAAMGATFLLPVAEQVDLPLALAELARRDVPVVAGDPAAETSLFDSRLSPPVAVVVGGEANGLSQGVRSVVTRRLRIPMAPGVESLNAAVAAALLLYEAARR